MTEQFHNDLASHLGRKNEMLDHYEAECSKYRKALIAGIGANLNEMTSKGLPLEWSTSSGTGQMMAALNCETVEQFKDLINPLPNSSVSPTPKVETD
jgi:hypothetical protein